MESLPTTSVIIPTYNRKDSLYETLVSLAQQTWPADHFEVIIVDDGSTDGTRRIVEKTFPFTLRYFWQPNQGDAAARNLGVQRSQADILVFLDDDILVEPNYLTSLIQAHGECQNRIVVGTAYLWLETEINPLSQASRLPRPLNNTPETVKLTFAEVCSNNMSLKREAYIRIGMMQGLDFRGSSIWCDVDFAYRAYQQDFEFCRSSRAICWHRDYVARNLESQKSRMRKTAYRAVALFQKYPDLLPHLPMFYDKTPIIWRQDSPRLIARKLVRYLVSSRPALWSMEQVASALEKCNPSLKLLRSLRRWIIGAHIFQGYRKALRELGQR